ncbi:ataxin-7-like [Anguilla rostrata]|uniref:ataxin-7-like n=1 Tax=Anguilla rostrata TaxID=7938 RepID=UPI0030CD3433
MSERADDDVKREQRKATRQSRQQQIQQGESVTAMATVGERRSLPSPEILLGQPWSNWVDAAKLNGNVGTESEESLKECGKNREAMRLCRDDMPIFGQCPAQDDFYLVMCSCCSQVVKPQAFQAHYERRHGSSSKHPSAAFPVPTLVSRRNGSAPNAKILKTAKEKLPAHLRVLHHKLLSPSVKVEKIPLKASDGHAPSASIAVSSSLRPSLNCPSIPKAPLLPPGHIPNGKTLHTSLEKKQDNGSGSRRHLHKKLSEREFNADFHCGVLDLTTRKPCTRSLTCKTHSLTQRRAVLGRRKRFDALLADHKGRAREKELQCSADPSRQTPPLRDANPAPCPSPVSHGNSTADAKPSAPSKPRPHNPSLPRPNSYPAHLGGNSHTQEDPAPLQESSLQSAPTPDGTSRLSSDEGENEEREEDCHYSGYHPRPAAFCTFGSRQFGRSCYMFSRRWDRVRHTLSAMVEKHISSQMWKKIPPATQNSTHSMPHRTNANSLAPPHPSTSGGGFLPPAPQPLPSSPYSQSLDSRAVLSYGTTLSARPDRPPYNSAQPRPGPSWTQVPSLASSRPLKTRPSAKPFRPREPPPANSTASLGVAKKRKSSSPTHPTESSSSSTSSSSFVSPVPRKNCALNPRGPGSARPLSLMAPPPHAGVHHGPGLGSALSLRLDQSGRGPPMGSPAEPIKRMSVVMNSSDSTLSLGPFVAHAPVDSLEGKRRKGPGAPGPGRPLKMAKLPTLNNVHGKHSRSIPGSQGLPNNAILQQPKARP